MPTQIDGAGASSVPCRFSNSIHSGHRTRHTLYAPSTRTVTVDTHHEISPRVRSASGRLDDWKRTTRRPRACGARFAVDAHRELARTDTPHAPHASVDGEGVGVSPVRGPWRAGGRRTGCIDEEGTRGVDHGTRSWLTTNGVGWRCVTTRVRCGVISTAEGSATARARGPKSCKGHVRKSSARGVSYCP